MNECNNYQYTNYIIKKKRDLFNLNVRPGLNYARIFSDEVSARSGEVDFDYELSFRFGVEAEFIMPFNKNKWAVIIEPTYQYYKSEKELPNQVVKVDYQSLEIPIGIRHYFFLNDNSKFFVNGLAIIDLERNSFIDYELTIDLEISTTQNFGFGVGYKHNDRYSVELRGQTRRETLTKYVFLSAGYYSYSLIFGYSFF